MTTTATDNAAWLRAAFVARLLAARPASVLDVGAGAGQVLEALRDAGVEATGCEAQEESVRALAAAGLRAVRAAAENLPFEDGAFDWVCMRHVPHHLADPGAGLREALRVARRGLLVAEPWYDLDLPGQRAALAAERWLKAQHRRAGMVHAENLPAAELLELAGVELALPDSPRCEVTRFLRLRRRGVEDLEASAAPWLAALDDDDVQRAAWSRVLEQAASGGVSWNGSVVVALEQPFGARDGR